MPTSKLLDRTGGFFARRFVSYHGVAAASFSLYDNLLTFDDEVETIWSKPNGSWIKWQFLFMRYTSFLIQFLNSCLEVGIVDVLNTVFVTAIEIVLMARVYALYNQNLQIVYLFLVLLLGKTVATAVGIWLNWPSDGFKELIWLDVTPDSFAYFGFASVFSQLTILVLTFGKYSSIKGMNSPPPIIGLMMRDGTLAFIPIFLLCLGTSISAMLSCPYAPVGDYWLLTIVSSAGCRVILNMQLLPETTGTTRLTAGVQLTTIHTQSLELSEC
ncbi:hypothetical protein BDN72DRAFT_469940 [Pluteus cervinus]|uniref:Uncharacterized protein n=1 Tax=Pluteus cervinus TaxID=181527 RepID=A0ACD3B0F8_9AGAR|nr:hypothetical protein BDN72DRAFT_469940 [Pluteus cervinus]